MNDQNQERAIEVVGEDVDEAVAKGLRQLGLTKTDVTVDVLDEGRRGFLGFGGREARVRLTPLPTGPETIGKTPAPSAGESSESIPDAAPREEVDSSATASDAPDAAPAATQVAFSTVEAKEQEAEAESAVEEAGSEPAAPADEDEEQTAVAKEIVQTLLEQLEVDATIETYYSEPDDVTGRQMLVLNIVGDDLGDLIGARGEVLNDLQYLARLMAGHVLHRRADFLIDVDSYREKRQKALAQLAQRMAKKAVKRGQPVTLEPMSPYDRRIIHMTLREDKQVSTQSTGEGSRRRVRIYPK